MIRGSRSPEGPRLPDGLRLERPEWRPGPRGITSRIYWAHLGRVLAQRAVWAREGLLDVVSGPMRDPKNLDESALIASRTGDRI